MKQIVVNGGETYGSLLTPKWVVEYYKRKGIELFYYLAELFEDGFIYELKDPNELDDNTCIYHGFYLLKNVGEEITKSDFEKVDFNLLLDEYNMFKDREDKILIDIVKEINNENLIKIIEVPDDVEYDVVQSNCGFSEWVEEKHRLWY